ncbi:hypothetical protein BD289DRAFT_481257 [Coniella lustricola]|uniref:Uncharacterized protein n=1 Tax=Coniella lustricola TaxID=2025994 RepID=A0A2T3ACX3_9PEZI|nr:hypothetical protein BD289DRAFT_481257 [Coniella lustricola]
MHSWSSVHIRLSCSVCISRFPQFLNAESANIKPTITAMTLLHSRALTNILGITNLTALGAATMYFRSHHTNNLEAHEARMDELEGTLRGHIGIIEDSLERLEGQKIHGQSDKAQALYTARGRDEKK